MATIGSFTASGNGFIGTVKTLNLSVKATIRTVEPPSDKEPDYRILAGATEFGAASKKHRTKVVPTSRSSWTTFPAPICATLIGSKAKIASPSSGPGPTGI